MNLATQLFRSLFRSNCLIKQQNGIERVGHLGTLHVYPVKVGIIK